MKRYKFTELTALFVAAATMTITSSNALTFTQVQEVKAAVLSVPVPEMPAKAASLVKRAAKKDRQAVALTALRTILAKHRAAAPLVISAISKVAPELAPTMAAAGVEIVPDQAVSIASAAVAAAPAQAQAISDVVTQVVPTQASTVVAAVNQTVARSAAPVSGTPVSVASATPGAASVAQATLTRGSAHVHPSSGGTVTISDRPISPTGGAGNGQFPTNPPEPAQDPRVIYNQPPQ